MTDPEDDDPYERIDTMCKNCMYWAVAVDDYGYCKVRPPIIIESRLPDRMAEAYEQRLAMERQATHWPVTEFSDDCGEWKPRRLDKS